VVAGDLQRWSLEPPAVVAGDLQRWSLEPPAVVAGTSSGGRWDLQR